MLHLTDPCACKTRHPLFKGVPFSSLSQRFWGCNPPDTHSQYMGLSLEIQKHISSHFSSGSSDKSYSASNHGQDRNACFRQRKLMSLAIHILLHHDGQGMNKSHAGRTRSIKVESCTYPASDFLMGELRAKLDRFASALHCSLGSLSHLQTCDIFSALAFDQIFLSFPWASTLISDQKCLLYHMEMIANIHRVSLAYLLVIVQEMRQKMKVFTYTVK